jgi:hypothetical protein
MRRIAFSLVGVVALAGVVAPMAALSGQAGGEAAPKERQPQAGSDCMFIPVKRSATSSPARSRWWYRVLHPGMDFSFRRISHSPADPS